MSKNVSDNFKLIVKKRSGYIFKVASSMIVVILAIRMRIVFIDIGVLIIS